MRISEEEYQALMTGRAGPEKKKPKYRNREKVVDDITFQSTKEANRYIDLKAWQQSGQITHLLRQQPLAITVNGQYIGDYVSDFSYRINGKLVVEDVKSKMTRKLLLYIWKKKLVKAVHGIEIQEI